MAQKIRIAEMMERVHGAGLPGALGYDWRVKTKKKREKKKKRNHKSAFLHLQGAGVSLFKVS